MLTLSFLENKSKAIKVVKPATITFHRNTISISTKSVGILEDAKVIPETIHIAHDGNELFAVFNYSKGLNIKKRLNGEYTISAKELSKNTKKWIQEQVESLKKVGDIEDRNITVLVGSEIITQEHEGELLTIAPIIINSAFINERKKKGGKK